LYVWQPGTKAEKLPKSGDKESRIQANAVSKCSKSSPESHKTFIIDITSFLYKATSTGDRFLMFQMLFKEGTSGAAKAAVTMYTGTVANDGDTREKVQRVLVGHHPTSKMVVMPAK
jgi:hypothetical protein